MNVKKALERLSFRFGRGNFRPNQLDVDALNELIEYVGGKEKKQLKDNQLFGKLYIFLYGEFVNYYKCTVMDNVPQKELHRVLNKDIRILVQEVADRLNMAEIASNSGQTMGYDEVAQNMQIMVNAALNTFNE